MEDKKYEATKVWVLADERLGGAYQAIAIAEKLGEKFEIKNFKYNFWANLPNFLLTFFPFQITKTSRYQIEDSEVPDILISSGRRSAAIAVYLKETAKKPVKIIQIMRPGLSAEKFDTIILPQHDNFRKSSSSNIIRTIGAINNIEKRIEDSTPSTLSMLQDKFIVVMIGGAQKNYDFELDNVMHLSEILENIADHHGIQMLISFSRRTPKSVKNYFKDKFSLEHMIYDPESIYKNPYPNVLKKAEFIICTTDSISMCSEAVTTGKPVYLFKPGRFRSRKHNFFTQQLLDLGLARNLDMSTKFLETYEYEKLDELSRVVEIIREKFSLFEKESEPKSEEKIQDIYSSQER